MTDSQPTPIEVAPGQPVVVQPVNPFSSKVLQGLAIIGLLWVAKRWGPLTWITNTDAKEIIEYIWGSSGGLLVLWGRLTTSHPLGFGAKTTIIPTPAVPPPK